MAALTGIKPSNEIESLKTDIHNVEMNNTYYTNQLAKLVITKEKFEKGEVDYAKKKLQA